MRYAKIAKRMLSIEDDADWLRRIRTLLAPISLPHLAIEHHPFDFWNPSNFPDSSYLRVLQDDSWDVMIIDGQDWSFQERITCFRHAEKFTRSGSIIVLDDYWRYEAALAGNHRALQVEKFESVGPCRRGVTSIAFFYY